MFQVLYTENGRRLKASFDCLGAAQFFFRKYHSYDATLWQGGILLEQ